MKHHPFFVPSLAAAVLAVALPAFAASSLLTPAGVRYAIEPSPETPQVEIARAEGQQRARLVVPSTQDVSPEFDVQIAFDNASNTLFVVWSREGSAGSEVRYARLTEAGEWSTPRLITAGSGAYRGLRFVLTHPAGDEGVTLLHAVWWSLNGTRSDAEYALLAFESGRFLSGGVHDLETLAAYEEEYDISAGEYEDTGNPLHPALALERSGEGVDVVFGTTLSTAVTRLNVTPRKVSPTVRIWKPVGRTGGRTQRSHLTSTEPSAPVHGFIRKGNVALYTVGEDFRFVVLQGDGSWSPIREVRIDEDNTAGDLLRELQHTVEELTQPEEDTSSIESR